MDNNQMGNQPNIQINNVTPKKNNTVICLILLIVIGINIFLGYELLKKNENGKTNKDNESGAIDDNDEGFVYDENDILEEMPNDFIYGYISSNSSNSPYLKKGEMINFTRGMSYSKNYTCQAEECRFYIPSTSLELGSYKYTTSRYAVISLCETGKCKYIDSYAGDMFYNENNQNVAGTVVIYNIMTGESKRIENVKSRNQADANFVYVTLSNGDNYVVSYDGTVNRKIEEPALYCWEGCGISDDFINYSDNLIVTIKNEKYGIEQLSTGNVIIDHSYDKIELSNNGFEHSYYRRDIFVGEKDGKQNFYRLKDNTPVLKNNYEKVILISKDKFVSYKDKKISIKNMNEEDLIEPISVETLDQTGPQNPNGIYIAKTENKDVIEIVIPNTNPRERYSFNLVTNEFKKTN